MFLDTGMRRYDGVVIPMETGIHDTVMRCRSGIYAEVTNQLQHMMGVLGYRRAAV